MKKKAKKAPDVTAAFCSITDDYIGLADVVGEARNYAQFAVIAWNISLYPKEQIAEKIELVANAYEKSNPGVISAKKLAHDLQALVDKKLEKCPKINFSITKVGVEEGEDDHFEIRTESVPFKLPENNAG